ncbi:hypothetical protein EV383_4566 [Pseudonocardia sediminis]|uniref:Uncharacterized protein n=1 Tax=Pseudonocardia sediminis TaxID=1397368 RepID=A0A4V2FR86_PSEST|nr:hypothetical protein [Pseudonocardia sediminis]RZT87640.1 hypothetical protein EV383_4566 [Pseudonocardia sediminis]
MTPELTRPEPVPTGRTSVQRMLDSLDDLVRRHRALAAREGEDDTLHAELIAAELAQQIAVMRRPLPRQHNGSPLR